MLTDVDIISKYGKPGDSTQLSIISLPYPMKIAWDTSIIINKMQCHNLVAANFYNVFKDLLAHYGMAEIQRLGIDLFGGCVNVRLQRGSKTKWSRHAWGVAIDLDPARNKLKETKKTARFARPEYKPLIDIFYKHGFINLGREKDYDWMHFEIAS